MMIDPRNERRAKNSLRGRKAKAAGNSLEKWLDAQHMIAKLEGILAHIDKIDPPAIVVGGRIQFGERTVSDYVGMLDGGAGRYFACEAKSTESQHFYRSDVKPKQQEHLETVTRGGGLALLVVEFRAHARRYAIPWRFVPWKTLRSAESVSVDDLEDWWILPGRCYLERFHPRSSTPSAVIKKRVYPRD